MKTNWSLLKQTLAGLREEEGKFLILLDEKGAIVCANASVVRNLQLSDLRNHSINFLDLLHPQNRPTFQKTLDHCREFGAGGQAANYVKNGHYHPMYWEVKYLGDAAFRGKTRIYLCAGYRLSEKMNREVSQRAAEQEALFNVFMEHSPHLAWMIDDCGNLAAASRSFFTYFGLKKQDCLGRKLADLVSPEAAEALYEKHLNVLKTGQPIEFARKAKWNDGTHFFFHINIFPVEAKGGRRMLGGYAVNLAEAVEKQVRETHERFLLLCRATSDAIWEWDMQTGRIFRNEALLDMIGYQPVDSKGLSWWLRRIHPDDRNRVSDKVKQTTEEGRLSWQDEYRFRCADGQYKPIFDKGFVVYENGLPVKMIGSLQDISNLRKLETELMNEKLGRQKEISETAIKVQEKERTRIGHELHDNVNQILSTAQLFLTMIKLPDADSKELIGKSSEYLLMAIEEIRKLSKELVVPQLKTTRLVDSIQSIIDDIHLAHVLQIKFAYDQESELLSTSKKVTIFRIVQEQFRNILRYSKAKNVDLMLQRSENEMHLIIKDDGVGFDIKRASKGIGLSNIHDRVRFYNGRVDVRSAPGKGCVLSVSIPVND